MVELVALLHSTGYVHRDIKVRALLEKYPAATTHLLRCHSRHHHLLT